MGAYGRRSLVSVALEHHGDEQCHESVLQQSGEDSSYEAGARRGDEVEQQCKVSWNRRCMEHIELFFNSSGFRVRPSIFRWPAQFEVGPVQTAMAGAHEKK